MTEWRKSSRSNTTGGDCVELRGRAGCVDVRDSKDPSGPKLALTPAAWRDLVGRIKGDETT